MLLYGVLYRIRMKQTTNTQQMGNGQVTNSFDKLIALKQANCDHVEQNKITANEKTYCGDCALELNN